LRSFHGGMLPVRVSVPVAAFMMNLAKAQRTSKHAKKKHYLLIRKLVRPHSAGLCRVSRKARVRRNGGPHFKNTQGRGWPGRDPPAGSATEARLRRCIRLTWGAPCLRECALQLDFSRTLIEALPAFESVLPSRALRFFAPLRSPTMKDCNEIDCVRGSARARGRQPNRGMRDRRVIPARPVPVDPNPSVDPVVRTAPDARSPGGFRCVCRPGDRDGSGTGTTPARRRRVPA